MATTSTSGPQRVALVAGASRGIGADTAKAFARAGHAVVLGARDADALGHVVEDIEATGVRPSRPRATSVMSIRCARLVQLAVDSFGRLDAAFNNATDGPMPSPLADIDPDEFDLGIRDQRARHVPRDEVRDPGDARQRRRRHRQHGLGRRCAGHDQPRRLRRPPRRASSPSPRPLRSTTPTMVCGSMSSPPARSSPTISSEPARTHSAWPAASVPDGPRRHVRGGRRRRAVAVLRAVVVHHRRHDPDRRRPARRAQATADVPPRRRHGAHLITSDDHP